MIDGVEECRMMLMLTNPFTQKHPVPEGPVLRHYRPLYPEIDLVINPV